MNLRGKPGWLLIVIILWVGFFFSDFRQLSLGEDFLHFLPEYRMFLQWLQQAHPVFWSPYARLGLPWLFIPEYAVFSPSLGLVFAANLLVNPGLDLNFLGKTLQLHQYLWVLIGAFSMSAFLRFATRLSRAAAGVGGLIYAFAVFSLLDLTVIPSLPGKMLFPLLALAVHRLCLRPQKTTLFHVVGLHTALFLFGYPYYFFFIPGALGLLAGFHGFKALLRYLSALLLAISLGGFFLLPAWYVVRQGEGNFSANWGRPQAIDSPLRLLNLVNPVPYNAYFSPLDQDSWVSSGFMTWSALVLPFLLLGLAALRRSRLAIWLVVIGIFSVIYSLGGHLNVPYFMSFVPLVSLLRSWHRILLLAFFAGSVFIAVGLDSCRSHRKSVVLIPLGLLFGLLALAQVGLAAVRRFPVSNSLILATLYLGIGLVLIWILRRRFTWGLAVLCLAYLFIHRQFYLQRQVALLPVNYHNYLNHPVLTANPPVGGQLWRHFFETSQFAYNTESALLYNFGGIKSIPPPVFNQLNSQLDLDSALRLANVRYRVTHDRLPSPAYRLVDTLYSQPASGLPLIGPLPHLAYWSDRTTAPFYLYELADYLPRFFVPQTVIPCPATVCSIPAHPDQLSNSALLTSPVTNPEARLVTIRVDSYQPSRVALTVNSPAAVYITSSEPWDTGWHLRINNQPRPLLLTNGYFRGFFVPSGTSRVVMTYLPPLLPAGLAVTLLGFAAAYLVNSKYTA